MVNIRWCPNLRCIQVRTCYEVFKSQSLTWYMKLCEGGIHLWTMYSDILFEQLDFFYGKLNNQKYAFIPICKIFGPNLNIIIIILWHLSEIEVWIIYRKQLNYWSISKIWIIIEHTRLNMIFFILIDVHVVLFWITFIKHT